MSRLLNRILSTIVAACVAFALLVVWLLYSVISGPDSDDTGFDALISPKAARSAPGGIAPRRLRRGRRQAPHNCDPAHVPARRRRLGWARRSLLPRRQRAGPCTHRRANPQQSRGLPQGVVTRIGA